MAKWRPEMAKEMDTGERAGDGVGCSGMCFL